MSAWGGRKSRQLVAVTLANKGTVCWLCGLDGADSADHDPPRQDLIERGVPDPDAPEYLWPSHLKCNVRRARRPVTDELRAELRRRRLRDLELALAADDLSPRFADRARSLSERRRPGRAAPALSPPRFQGKIRRDEERT